MMVTGRFSGALEVSMIDNDGDGVIDDGLGSSVCRRRWRVR